MATKNLRRCKKALTLRLNDKEDKIVEQYCLENGTTYTEAVRTAIKLLKVES